MHLVSRRAARNAPAADHEGPSGIATGDLVALAYPRGRDEHTFWKAARSVASAKPRVNSAGRARDTRPCDTGNGTTLAAQHPKYAVRRIYFPGIPDETPLLPYHKRAGGGGRPPGAILGAA